MIPRVKKTWKGKSATENTSTNRRSPRSARTTARRVPTIVVITTAIMGGSLLCFHSAKAQSPNVDPRLVVGGGAGQFRVSLDRFEEFYDGRWGWCYGGHASVRVYGNLCVTFAGRYFEKSGKEGLHEPTGLSLSQASWQERWYLIGLRRWSFGMRRWGSYLGLGYALFYVDENPEISVLEVVRGHSGGKQRGNGFFMCLGVEYSLSPWAGLYAELEATSAGVGGRSGFEGSSIGGFYLSLGVNVRLF